ncbi:MAG: NAD(P)H-dependent oxidoreductase [Firmicutes bacterium]|nr:NAD(P)H-dependent oxidoreductase [Bacillota bacterium]
MQLMAICGSARKQGNTATMLEQVIAGAASAGAATELVNLFDLDYKGCIACYACKLKDGKSYGRCAVNDGLKPLLKRIEESDVIVLGSPVYCGNLSGQMRAFTDRLLFQYLIHGAPSLSPRPKDFKTALIATMNVNAEIYARRGIMDALETFALMMARTLGSCELLALTDTVQFDDYAKYVYLLPDQEEKATRNPKIAREDLQRAFDLGVRLVKP